MGWCVVTVTYLPRTHSRSYTPTHMTTHLHYPIVTKLSGFSLYRPCTKPTARPVTSHPYKVDDLLLNPGRPLPLMHMTNAKRNPSTQPDSPFSSYAHKRSHTNTHTHTNTHQATTSLRNTAVLFQ